MSQNETPVFDSSTRLMNVDELAAWLSVDRNTIYHWRVRGVGPRAIRVGDGTRGSLRYRRGDVEAWLKSREDQERAACDP